MAQAPPNPFSAECRLSGGSVKRPAQPASLRTRGQLLAHEPDEADRQVTAGDHVESEGLVIGPNTW
jgi:hypothetical protein